MKYQGWIKIHRKIQDNEIYNELPFDYLHAFVDLLLMACFEEKIVEVRGISVCQHLGEVITSTYILANKWGWTRQQVRYFLEKLSGNGMLKVESSKVWTMIKIVNYSKYQIGAMSSKAEKAEKAVVEEVKAESVPECNTNENTALLEVFFFEKCLKNAKEELLNFINYYEKTDWRTTTGVKIRSKKAAAKSWEVKGGGSKWPAELISRYRKVYLLAPVDARHLMLEELIDIEDVAQPPAIIITCSVELYKLLESIAAEKPENWAKIWIKKLKYKIPKK